MIGQSSETRQRRIQISCAMENACGSLGIRRTPDSTWHMADATRTGQSTTLTNN